MSTQGINQNEPPTREECECDESMQRPFIWNPTADQLAEYAANDPWNR
jgi:hypothetical protein